MSWGSPVGVLAPTRPPGLPAKVDPVRIPQSDFLGYSKGILKALHQYFTTTHCLVVQADGFIVNPGLWTDEFLRYDYIGAPWPEQLRGEPGGWTLQLNRNRVGNGGFSLRSRKLMSMASEIDFDRLDYPTRSEDIVLCHYMYEEFHGRGARYAPVDVAARFSMEIPAPEHRDHLDGVFGFHGKHLLPEVLTRLPASDFADLRRRRAAMATPARARPGGN